MPYSLITSLSEKKPFWFITRGLAFLLIVGCIVALFQTIYQQNRRYDYGITASDAVSSEMALNDISSKVLSTAPQISPTVATITANDYFEAKQYQVTVKSHTTAQDCTTMLGYLHKDYIQRESTETNKHSCYFRVKVAKEQESEFLSELQQYTIVHITSNSSNTRTQYLDTNKKIKQLSEQIDAINEQIEFTKKTYGELWSSMKTHAPSADTIEALNQLITTRSSLLSNFMSQKTALNDAIDQYTSQHESQSSDINFITFDISIADYVLIDRDSVKDGRYRSLGDFVIALNNTLQSLTINLLTFSINTLIYIALGGYILLKLLTRGYKSIKKSSQ